MAVLEAEADNLRAASGGRSTGRNRDGLRLALAFNILAGGAGNAERRPSLVAVAARPP